MQIIFDPAIQYDPWTKADRTLWKQADFTAARADSRDPAVYGDANGQIRMSKYGTIVGLGQPREVTSDNSFRFVIGMTIPSGTRYRTTEPSTARICNSNGFDGVRGTGGAWSTITSNAHVGANCSVQISYIPATFYLPVAAPAPTGYNSNDVNRPIIANACGPGCNMRRYQILKSNYLTTTDFNNASNNFANWFQYHRNRILSIIGSESRTLANVDNMRVGYFTINNRKQPIMYDIGDDTSRKNVVRADLSPHTTWRYAQSCGYRVFGPAVQANRFRSAGVACMSKKRRHAIYRWLYESQCPSLSQCS